MEAAAAADAPASDRENTRAASLASFIFVSLFRTDDTVNTMPSLWPS
jgi:hypothetical protein